jgi:hypothetical protein
MTLCKTHSNDISVNNVDAVITRGSAKTRGAVAIGQAAKSMCCHKRFQIRACTGKQRVPKSCIAATNALRAKCAKK